MEELLVFTVRTASQMEEALSVRRDVFIEEQDVPEEEEIDGHDADPAVTPSAVHVLATFRGEPVATGRLLLDAPPGGRPHVGRVAVLREHRGRGYGRAVMAALQEEAQGRGYDGITLAAQLPAIPFYERLGYAASGGVFLDAGIEHRRMDLSF